MRRILLLTMLGALAAGTGGLARADGAGSAAPRPSSYDPVAYLSQAPRANGRALLLPFGQAAPRAVGAPQPAVGGAVVCDQSVEPPPSPCQANDPGCSAILERRPVQGHAKGGSGPATPQVAQQLFARVYDSCRPTVLAGAVGRGFRPEASVSLPGSEGFAQPGERRLPAVTATLGINGYF